MKKQIVLAVALAASTLAGCTDPNDPNIVASTIISGYKPMPEGCVEFESAYQLCCNFDGDQNSTTELLGLTIKAGTDEGCSWPHQGERAIYCNNSSPTIRKCRIVGGTAETSPWPPDVNGIDCNNSSSLNLPGINRVRRC